MTCDLTGKKKKKARNQKELNLYGVVIYFLLFNMRSEVSHKSSSMELCLCLQLSRYGA